MLQLELGPFFLGGRGMCPGEMSMVGAVRYSLSQINSPRVSPAANDRCTKQVVKVI